MVESSAIIVTTFTQRAYVHREKGILAPAGEQSFYTDTDSSSAVLVADIFIGVKNRQDAECDFIFYSSHE